MTNAVGQPGELLFHGTRLANLSSIRRLGLIPAEPTFWGEGSEPRAVYLTGGLQQAYAHAESADSLLVVDVTGLPLLVLGFVTCPLRIEPWRISAITAWPRLVRELKRATFPGAADYVEPEMYFRAHWG